MEVCRLCQMQTQQRSQHKDNFTSLILRGLSVNIEEDCSCCPSRLCESCRKDLHKFKKHYQHKKSPYSFKIKYVSIQHQRTCSKGLSKDNVPSENSNDQSALKEAADVAARAHSFASWIQNETQVFAKICMDGTSPIQVQLEANGRWKVFCMGQAISYTNSIFQTLPATLSSSDVHRLFEILSSAKLCEGNPEFSDLCRQRFPDSLAVFLNKDNETAAFEKMIGSASTVVCKDCQLLTLQSKCDTCKNYKKILTAMNQKVKNRSSTDPTMTHAKMSKTELQSALKEAKHQNKQLKRELKQMHGQINRETNRHGVNLEANQSEEFRSIMDTYNKQVEDSFNESPDDPKLMLWKQHFQNMKKTSAKHQRWHPLILKWCIGLHHKSPAAYEFIRDSGMITLPHRTTLRNYTRFTDPTPGYNADIISHIMEQTGIDRLTSEENFRKNVSLVFDEIKIKSGLVYRASSGKLIGYTDIGSANNDLMEFSRRIQNGGKSGPPEIASHILSVMVRGIFSPLHTSIGFFPTCTASGDQLYSIVWEGVEVLHAAGFKVRAFIADGAATNRKFFKMHSEDRHRLTYCTTNRYCHERRDLYFICDVPHLVKTVRNNWENSGYHNKTRTLMYKQQPITWSQLKSMYDRVTNCNSNSPGYTPLYKITASHLELNPSLRMKVKLAAQVLSETVANAFVFDGRPQNQSVTLFVKNMDKFFDCLNVSTPYQGIRMRKENRLPYTSLDDDRLKWLMKDFIGWLEDWEKEALNTPNLTRNQQRKRCLSEQTLDGLRITTFSFVSLAKELLPLPGVKYLCSDKFNQDPQEEYFSKIRASGGNRTNPTVDQYSDASVRILIGGACIRGSLKGNSKRQPSSGTCTDTWLPKKRIR